MKLFDNPKPVVFAILAVLGLFFTYKGCQAGEVELAATFTGQFNDGYALTYMERVADDRIDIGVTLIGEQDFKDTTLENNGNVWAAFVAQRPDDFWPVFPSEVSIGAAYWIKTSRIIGDELGYQLGLKWRFGDWSIGIRHWSNAGTVKPNRGQDMLTFGYRF